MAIQLNQFPALVLNADFTPKSVLPLSVLNWQDAAKGLYSDRYVRVVDYDREIVTQNDVYRLPSVIAVKQYRHVPHVVPFTRQNIWIRDGGKCAYCRCVLTTKELTFDHVVPQCLGGRTEWENIVCACQPCNGRKAAKSLKESGLTLHVTPHVPNVWNMAKKSKALGTYGPTPKEWLDFLYWGVELLPD